VVCSAASGGLSPEQWDTVRHFTATEFRRPADMDAEFIYFLDGVRDAFGEPLVITSDARTVAEEEALPGHAEPPTSSLHVADPVNNVWARAVDLPWIPLGADRWNLTVAVQQVAHGRPVELEFVPFGGNAHIHLGLFRDERPSVLIFSQT
jgi:hypothetical protein